MKNGNSINNKVNSYNSFEEKEAFELKRKAESKLNPGCCLDTLCTSRKSMLNQSCDLYQKSAEIYKNCLQFRKAGECYEKCSEIKLELNESPIEFYKQSISCYQNVNSNVNVKNNFFKMNNYLEKKGKIYEVGKNCENMGIIYENKGQKDEAIYFYKEAIKYYGKDVKYSNLKINLQNKLEKIT